MNRFRKIAICIVSGLVLNITARAEDNGLLANPYALVATRNIFGLKPADVALPLQAESLPKISPNGIMSIFGRLQVLFKVEVPPVFPSNQATEKSYILSESQQQDDIAVVLIDEKAGLVTFNNHGVLQQIFLPDNANPAR